MTDEGSHFFALPSGGFPGGPGRLRGPRGDPPPILFLTAPKRERAAVGPREKAPGAETRAAGASSGKYGSRANRPGGWRRPRRPCAVPRPVKNCVPAFDGGVVGWGGDLNGRISTPARSASLRAAPAVAVGFLIGVVGADGGSARCPGDHRTSQPAGRDLCVPLSLHLGGRCGLSQWGPDLSAKQKTALGP